jgi:hypothetical protein
MGTEGVIRARLKTEADLEEFVALYEGDTGGEPVEADRDNLVVEVNVFSHGDRVVLTEFLRERDAEILVDEIHDDEDLALQRDLTKRTCVARDCEKINRTDGLAI